MKIKLDYIYKNQDGEHFKSIEKDGKIVLENPSYPFVFLPEVQEPLEEIGSAIEFSSLVTKENYQFHEGDSLTVEIDGNGDLKVKEVK